MCLKSLYEIQTLHNVFYFKSLKILKVHHVLFLIWACPLINTLIESCLYSSKFAQSVKNYICKSEGGKIALASKAHVRPKSK